MASLTDAQISNDLAQVLADFPVTLTVVLPASSVGEEYAASKESLEDGFFVEESGRETKLDTRFYINLHLLNPVTHPVPQKGWVFDDGDDEYKVNMDKIYADGVCLRIDCSARYSKGS